jgi:uncharacterized protein (DUF433 family)
MTLTVGTEQIPLTQNEQGTIRVGQTRVTLESVIYCFQEGASPEGIVDAYPTLTLSDVYLVLGYYLRHPNEVAAYLQAQHQDIVDIRAHDEALVPPRTGLRAQLLARQAQRNGR